MSVHCRSGLPIPRHAEKSKIDVYLLKASISKLIIAYINELDMKRILFLAAAGAVAWFSAPVYAQNSAVNVQVIDTVSTSLPEVPADAGYADSVENSEYEVRKVGFSQDNNDDMIKFLEETFSSHAQPPKRWKWYGGHWAGVGIYYSGLVRDIGHLSLPEGAEYMRQTPASIGVNINFADLTLVSNRHFGLITGLGMEINNFRFDENVGLISENGYIRPDYSYDMAGVELKKSKLTTMYLNIPLLVEFQFGRAKAGKKCPAFVNFGLVGGLRLHSHTKVQYRDANGNKQTEKQYGNLNLRNFHYGIECNVGYKWIALSARYYPQSIFTETGGPEVQQVNIGLSLMF